MTRHPFSVVECAGGYRGTCMCCGLSAEAPTISAVMDELLDAHELSAPDRGLSLAVATR